MYGAILINDDSIISSSWERLFIECTVQPLKLRLQILPQRLLWFCLMSRHQNHSFKFCTYTIHGSFPWWASLQLHFHSSCADISKCFINASTYLERTCDEHPLLHKITYFNKSFILFFNSLTMALAQVNAAIWQWSLDSLITVTGILAKSLCLASR